MATLFVGRPDRTALPLPHGYGGRARAWWILPFDHQVPTPGRTNATMLPAGAGAALPATSLFAVNMLPLLCILPSWWTLDSVTYSMPMQVVLMMCIHYMTDMIWPLYNVMRNHDGEVIHGGREVRQTVLGGSAAPSDKPFN